jgi:PA domain
MRSPLRSTCLGVSATLTLILAQATPAFAQGQILVFSGDPAGAGFNDPTPAAPVGGNPGTTVGSQRAQVFLKAAAIWTEKLQPTTDIFVLATFEPLGANVLGSAGTIFIFSDFPGAEYPATWYHSALGDKLAGFDLDETVFDIRARFSSQFAFYLGFDNNEPPGLVDLLPVVLHEMGHGLGFANFVDETSGNRPLDMDDIYSAYTLDVSSGKRWNDMTVAERQASAINVRKVSWDGLHVNAAVPSVLSRGEPSLVITNPASLGAFAVGTASFGAPITAPGITGSIALGLDPANAAGPSTTDGCSPLTNAVTGRIVLLDRGTCGFIVKVKNAQDAGAIAVLIADNVAGDPPAGLGGADPTIFIPSARISLPAGNAIKAALPGGVSGRLGVDLSILAGTDRVRGLMMVAAFNPVVPGSSISHYEAIAFRNQLMEPAINGDLTSSVQPPEDLTLPLMADIGWFSDHDGVPDGRDACLGSAQTPTVVIESCVSTAPNVVFSDGCRISDQVADCAVGARNHGAFVSCVAHLGNDLKKAGIITGDQKGSLQSCAASSSIGH